MDSARNFASAPVSEWNRGQFAQRQDNLASEEPLQIHLNGDPLTVTMRTPGEDLELAAGFIFTEGIVTRPEEIQSITQFGENTVSVDLAEGVDIQAQAAQRNFSATSSCGLCGKTTIESIRARGIRPIESDLRVDPALLCQLPDLLRASQSVFEHTGGLHAAAVFDSRGALLAVREDIGRHNAVDKIVGWALRKGRLPLSEHVLLVSGRGGFEIIQKAVAAGIPVLASVSAASTLAVEMAREMDLTLVGFLRGERFVIYSGAERLQAPLQVPTQ